jgi:hypothetical protein
MSVDLTRFKGALNKFDAILKKAETIKDVNSNSNNTYQSPTTNYVEPEMNDGSGLFDSVSESYSHSSKAIRYNKELALKSNLPDSIKKLMAENIIEQPRIQTDYSHLLENKPTTNQPMRPNNQLQSNNNGGLTREEMENIIKETTINFLTEHYTKVITEQTVAKTIKTLIKEGKISVKQKTNL